MLPKFYSRGLYSLLLALSGLIPAPSLATPPDTVTALQHSAEKLQLWDQPEWLNLVHYEAAGDAHVSQVDDPLFFNTSAGKTSPRAELLASIAGFFSTEVEGNQHPQCRFVARLAWLSQQLDIDASSLPTVSCPDYKEWRSIIRAERVTMVFPAYHLNSPSSMFGHTLLRLDPEQTEGWSEWLSFAVNFGANVNNDDNSIFYAFKGLTGGYPGIFIVAPYFEKIQEYNRIENRDIWEYPLNLTTEETERMVKHLWELKEINFDYYFFDENCSYRLLELLEVARPGLELTDEFALTAIPVDTVRAIERAGLIESVEYRPSQATVLQQQIDQMSEQDQDLVIALSLDADAVNQKPLIDFAPEKQKHIVEAAYKYLRYQQTGEARDPEIAKRSYQLLAQMNRYPSGPLAVPEKRPSQPEFGHLSKRANIGIGRRAEKDYAELALKMSFHDLEDNEAGFLRGAQINLGNLVARIDEEGTARVQRLDLAEIFSITPRNRFFTPPTWKIYTGLERQIFEGRDRLVSHVTGGAGVAYETGDAQWYTLAMLRLENNNGFEHNIEPALGFIAGMLYHSGWNTARLEFSGEQFSGDIYRLRSSYTHNFVLSRNHSLKLRAEHEWQSNFDFSDVNLSYQYYF